MAWFGYPSPTATWLLNDTPVKSGENGVSLNEEGPPKPATTSETALLEQEPGGTFILKVPKARRINTGRYQIRIAIDQQQTTSSCQVNVIGTCPCEKLIVLD